MSFLPLLWQVPAIFTAVPMVARLLPFKLAARAIPLFYALVSLAVMVMPDRIDLALAAAGLVSLLHQKVGLRLTAEEPPDMKEVAARLRAGYATIVYLLSAGYDRAILSLSGSSQDSILHDEPKDDKSEDEDYQEPPPAPPDKIPQHIPPL